VSNVIIKELTDFVVKHLGYTDRKLIRQYIKKHLEYGTCDFAFDNNDKIAYVCRWNIEGKKAVILDFAIAPEYRNHKGFIKWVLAKNLIRFPYVRFIEFKRQRKYMNRGKRIYAVVELLRRKNG